MKRNVQMKRRMCMNMFVILGAFHIIPVGIDNTVRVNVQVNDDVGMPVKNAMVSAGTRRDRIDLWTNSSPGHRSVNEKTDKKGRVSLVFPCYSGHFRLAVSADGYYTEVPDKFSFKTSGTGFFTPNLAEYEKSITVTLKKKKNPIPMIARGFPRKRGRYFALKQGHGTYAYDFEMCDLLPPYGNGKIADINIDAYLVMTNGGYICRGSLTFNAGGAYKAVKHKTSDFKSLYHADTNACFKTSFPFVEYCGNNVYEYPFSPLPLLTLDEYFVFRVRETRNEKGELLSAHYGKIYGSICIGEWLDFPQAVFNPRPNDTNLEFDPERNLYHGKKERVMIP